MFGLALAWSEVRTDPMRHVALLDRLPIPGSWTLAASNITKNVLMGSSVTRYYLVDADPETLVEPVRQMLEAARLPPTPDYYFADWCNYTLLGDTAPPGPTGPVCPLRTLPPCSDNGPGGPTSCDIDTNIGGSERLAIDIFDRGEAANYYVGSEDHIVRAPSLAVVRITDDY